jgi:hypothetical protein
MKLKLLPAILLPALVWGCTHQIETRNDINVKPIEIKPIHITIDVNIKIDRALDDFYSDLDNEKKKSDSPAPAAVPPVEAPAAAVKPL